MMAMPPGGYHLDSLRPHDMNDYLNHHHLFSHVFAGASTIEQILKYDLERPQSAMATVLNIVNILSVLSHVRTQLFCYDSFEHLTGIVKKQRFKDILGEQGG